MAILKLPERLELMAIVAVGHPAHFPAELAQAANSRNLIILENNGNSPRVAVGMEKHNRVFLAPIRWA